MDKMMRLHKIIVLVSILVLTFTANAAVDIGDGEYVQFYHRDALGSPKAVSDEEGRILWYENTLPYGKSLGRVGADGTKFHAFPSQASRDGYTGHVNDVTSGLTYMKARFYDPDLGQFHSNDPVGVQESDTSYFARYSYSGGNPIRYTDPNGMFYGDPNAEDDDFPDDIEWSNAAGYDWAGYESDSESFERDKRIPNRYQDDLLASGQRERYWIARDAVGDGFAKDALRVVRNVFPMGWYTNQRAMTGGVRDLHGFGMDIAVAHHDYVKLNVDKYKDDRPGLLSRQEIDDYHNEVFESNGVSTDYYGGNIGLTHTYQIFCKACRK